MPIIPVLIEDCQVPSYLAQIQWADFRDSEEEGLKGLKRGIDAVREGHEPAPVADTSRAHAVTQLKEAYDSGDLSLICGAGVSIAAGLPDWSELLAQLLAAMFDDEVSASDAAPRLAKMFQEETSLSPPIVAQYLKSAFGNDFSVRVRDALYINEQPNRSSLMTDAVASLCRPRRGGHALRSVLTFNFDDLLERRLSEWRIDYEVIHDEGQRSHRSALPIFHVHGYLPSDSSLTPGVELVFAEEAYHSQFIDPFRWSNLIQLEALTQTTCLLVGISLTDPNLRRLLDVAMRKTQTQNHFIVWRRRTPERQVDEMTTIFQRRLSVLEEQDANRLGLGVIWVEDHTEIPGLLDQIGVA